MRAIFSMMRNEVVFMPMWLDYYGRFFDNIYILHHYTDKKPDLSDLHEKYKFREIPLKHINKHDTKWLNKTIMDQQKKLLKKYDVVLFAEADEFIIVDPFRWKDLGEYLDWFQKSDKDFVTCSGREVLQCEEPPINLKESILPQRKYWWYFDSYYKTLLSKIPLNWAFGFHYTDEMKKEYNAEHQSKGHLGAYIKSLADPNLILVHLQKMDWDIYNSRGRFVGNKINFDKGKKVKVEIPKRFKMI